LLPRRTSAGDMQKLVMFIPADAVERVADALFATGCGTIGANAQYTRCSFRTPGTGTFHGSAESHPAVGQPGRDEHVPEIRFETVVPTHRIAAAVAALRRAHPYEEPAFDLNALTAPPSDLGMGRRTELPRAMSLNGLADHCKRKLKLPAVTYFPPADRAKPIRQITLVAGSGGTMALNAPGGPPDCFITGELKHHDQLAYAAAGIAVILLSHAASEWPVLGVLATQIRQQFPTVRAKIAREASVRGIIR
jgi:hypothetical protein